MKTLQVLIFGVIMILGGATWAANCYICGAGSSDYCKNYCKYPGTDTQQNRKKCSDAGCKISGTASCPQAVNYKVCAVGSNTPLVVSPSNHQLALRQAQGERK